LKLLFADNTAMRFGSVILSRVRFNCVCVCVCACRHINWTLVNSVGEENTYVKDFCGFLSRATQRIRGNLSTTYFLAYCVKLVNLALDRFQYNFLKLRRISKMGANQLLLDLNGMHSFLTTLPNAKIKPELGETPVTISTAYVSVVENRVKYLEMVMKLCAVDDKGFDQLFQSIWPKGTKADYEMVSALRGKATILDPVGEKIKEGANTIGKFFSVIVGVNGSIFRVI
jgi:hypothetical protein